MIMRPGQPLLLPVKPWFIWLTLLLALILDMLLNIASGSRSSWLPAVLSVTVLFWTVHEPDRVNVGTAFVMGLLLDVHQGALLGQHALAFAALAYLGYRAHRRLLWFDVVHQALQLLPLLLIYHALQWLVRLAAGDGAPEWSALLSPVLETMLWPVAHWLLLAPQRRPHDPDGNRPI